VRTYIQSKKGWF